MSINFNFSNKKILITGASQGIGRELALHLAQAGGHVFALARNEIALDELCKENNNIQKIVCDLCDSEHVIKNILKPFHPFDHLINNAGIAILEKFGGIEMDSFNRTFNVNVRAPLLLSQVVSEQMILNSIPGTIVNISSQASLKPLSDHTTYCSSKAALDMITRCMAKELGEKGIRVNSVNPTVVMTEMGRKNWSDPRKASTLLDSMAIKNFAEVTDVVNSVMFLLSDGSRMTTGSVFPVDGGFTTQ